MNNFVNNLLNAPWIHVPTISSTNTMLMELPDSEITHGLTCTADIQTSGHGRRQRVWSSPPGGLYMSILLIPHVKPALWQQIAFVMGVAAADAVSDLHPDIKPSLKWPNDLLIENCKAGGILVQSKMTPSPRIVIGTGINVLTQPQNLPQNTLFPPCAISHVSKHPASVSLLAKTIRSRFAHRYATWLKNPQEIIDTWNSLSALKSGIVRIQVDDMEYSGVCNGILPNGNLVLQSGDSIREFHSGDIISFTSIPS